MGLTFIVVLLGMYLLLGLTVKRYTPRTRLLLMGITVAVPGFFYFLW
jgi:hypothetical protein